MAYTKGPRQRKQRMAREVVRDNPVCCCGGCEACTWDGVANPAGHGSDGCNAASTEADHIIALAEGGEDEYWNMQALCHWCHNRKTMREALRGKARRRSPAAGSGQHPGLID